MTIENPVKAITPSLFCNKMKRCILVASLLSLPLKPCFAKVEGTLPLVARSPDQSLEVPGEVETRHGHRFQGHITGADSKTLRMEITEGHGSADITFPREEVVSLRLITNSDFATYEERRADGDNHGAFMLLRSLYHQRAPLLHYLSDGDRTFFLDALPQFRIEGDPLTAIALARQLEPLVDTTCARRILARERILAYLQLEFRSEAKEEAEKWIAGESFFLKSAIGHYALAQIHFTDGKIEEALEHALTAVVFATDGADHLEDCYALSIRILENLGETSPAQTLKDEMNRRYPAFPTSRITPTPDLPNP